jgi:hypothetical protein
MNTTDRVSSPEVPQASLSFKETKESGKGASFCTSASLRIERELMGQ